MVIRFLIEKEFRQMMRNVVLPVVFVMLPLVMFNIVPRVATQEVKGLKICIIDNDRSTLSSRLIQKLSASSYFTLTHSGTTFRQALGHMEAGDADFIVEIAPDFERELYAEGKTKVMISANAVNGVKAGLGGTYLTQIIADYSEELMAENGGAAGSSQVARCDISPRFLYNPELDYKVFMIPGLIAMLLILIVGFLPAINIVSEKEKGTIEQMNVTPVGPLTSSFPNSSPTGA